jgi:rhodanese-related sulfurtransferase
MTGLHRAVAVAALVLGGGAAATDGAGSAQTRRMVADIAAGRDRTTAVALAERIQRGDGPRVFDLRSEADYQQFHIPSAARATLDDLSGSTLPRSASIVLYGDGAARAAQAWTLLRLRGYRDVAYLRDGLYEWIARVHEPALAVDATPDERADFERLAALSRYFGGQPRIDVERSDIARGSWTVGERVERPSVSTSLLVAAIRRRGC